MCHVSVAAVLIAHLTCDSFSASVADYKTNTCRKVLHSLHMCWILLHTDSEVNCIHPLRQDSAGERVQCQNMQLCKRHNTCTTLATTQLQYGIHQTPTVRLGARQVGALCRHFAIASSVQLGHKHSVCKPHRRNQVKEKLKLLLEGCFAPDTKLR